MGAGGSDFPKQGRKSVGVARQYTVRLGKVASRQAGMFLAYVSPLGRTLVLQLRFKEGPRAWAEGGTALRMGADGPLLAFLGLFQPPQLLTWTEPFQGQPFPHHPAHLRPRDPGHLFSPKQGPAGARNAKPGIHQELHMESLPHEGTNACGTSGQRIDQ